MPRTPVQLAASRAPTHSTAVIRCSPAAGKTIDSWRALNAASQRESRVHTPLATVVRCASNPYVLNRRDQGSHGSCSRSQGWTIHLSPGHRSSCGRERSRRRGAPGRGRRRPNACALARHDVMDGTHVHDEPLDEQVALPERRRGTAGRRASSSIVLTCTMRRCGSLDRAPRYSLIDRVLRSSAEGHVDVSATVAAR